MNDVVALKQKLLEAGSLRTVPPGRIDDNCDELKPTIDLLYEEGGAWRRTNFVANDPLLALRVALCLLKTAESETDVAFIGADLVEEIVSIANESILDVVLARMDDPAFCRCLSYCYVDKWSEEVRHRLEERCDVLLTSL